MSQPVAVDADLRRRMIELIERNRISATEVADALGKRGVIDGLSPINQGKFVVGEAHFICGYKNSNYPIHEQTREVPADRVIFCDMFETTNFAAFGDLVSKYLIMYKQARGLIVNGLMRDIPPIRKEGYPIWCKGHTPLGCTKASVELTPEIQKQIDASRTKIDGGILVSDDSGVTLIEAKDIHEETYRALEFIELQEDIWFFCIDTLKWSTYETVCEKRYLKELDVLPERLSNIVRQINLAE
jgi:4-hydroxy-4-methyl-2-oxoglutarate aldolase